MAIVPSCAKASIALCAFSSTSPQSPSKASPPLSSMLWRPGWSSLRFSFCFCCCCFNLAACWGFSNRPTQPPPKLTWPQARQHSLTNTWHHVGLAVGMLVSFQCPLLWQSRCLCKGSSFGNRHLLAAVPVSWVSTTHIQALHDPSEAIRCTKKWGPKSQWLPLSRPEMSLAHSSLPLAMLAPQVAA